jgi:hypothetical protein
MQNLLKRPFGEQMRFSSYEKKDKERINKVYNNELKIRKEDRV